VLRDGRHPPGPAGQEPVTGVTGQAAVRLRVDLIACDGRGLCAEALPELITLDDWGFPIVGDQAVPPRLLADARATARACPKLALWLDRG
jgi:ferredoxin